MFKCTLSTFSRIELHHNFGLDCTDNYGIYLHTYIHTYIHTYVTGPGKTGLIYTKYTCLYYGTYLLFCMCYQKSVNFIEFLMDFCIYDYILKTIGVTDKTLLHVKLSKPGQILHVDKTCFPRPGHIYL